MGDNYIKWLSDLSKKDLQLAGGKGANLGEMFNANFPVPQAFVVTTNAFFHFLKEAKLERQIKDLLNQIKVDETQDLTKKAQEIRDIITEAEIPQNLQDEITEAYDHFNIDLNEIKNSPGALAILKSSPSRNSSKPKASLKQTSPLSQKKLYTSNVSELFFGPNIYTPIYYITTYIIKHILQSLTPRTIKPPYIQKPKIPQSQTHHPTPTTQHP